MKLFLTSLLCGILAFSQSNAVGSTQTFRELTINAETIKEMVYTEGDAYHHFVGADPAEGKVPYFQMNALNKIDSTDFSYYLELNTKIYYSDLTTKEHSEKKIESNYSCYIEIIDNKERTVDQQFKEQLITIEKKYMKAAAFKSSKLNFFFAMDPGNYKIRVTFEDKISGKTNSKEIDFTLREWKRANFLISDLEYYDTYTHEPVINMENSINNRTDFILIQFQTYQRELDKNYTFSLDVYEQRKTIEKVGLTFVNLFKSIKNIFADDTIEHIIEPIYIKNWENVRTTHFMKHADMIEKKLFDKVEFPKNEVPPRKLVARVISTLHENQKIAIDEFAKEDQAIPLDSVDMANFNFDQGVVSDDGEITIATARNEITSEFSFEWEFIPQTKEEMKDAFAKLVYLEIDSIDYYEESDLADAQRFFMQIWQEKASKEKDESNPLSLMKLYYRKLDFCMNNFPDVNQDNNNFRRQFTNNGWISDKAKIYMKYGLPEEIHGDNIFNSKGEMIQHRRRPPVQLWAYKSGKKYYFKENSLITYN